MGSGSVGYARFSSDATTVITSPDTSTYIGAYATVDGGVIGESVNYRCANRWSIFGAREVATDAGQRWFSNYTVDPADHLLHFGVWRPVEDGGCQTDWEVEVAPDGGFGPSTNARGPYLLRGHAVWVSRTSAGSSPYSYPSIVGLRLSDHSLRWARLPKASGAESNLDIAASADGGIFQLSVVPPTTQSEGVIRARRVVEVDDW